MTRPNLSVGERIERAIEATRTVVHCNTNLGIVLLFAPIVSAIETLPPPFDPATLQAALKDTLRQLSVQDAEAAYRAIRLALPGGLGTSDVEDVASQPTQTLLTIMQHAAPYDQIAEAYSDGYETIFARGVTTLKEAYDAGESDLSAITRTFLTLAAHEPDTHIRRRHGEAIALQVQNEFKAALTAYQACGSATSPWFLLKNLDAKLKSQKFNPGTTADMTITSVLLLHLLQLDGYNARRQLPLGRRFSAESLSASAEIGRGLDPQI
jgi:triphosphoribosyl-dephospho-CoA synthase